MLRRALLIETIVKSGSVESFQLFVGGEADRIRVVLQEGGEKFLLPDPPSNRANLFAASFSTYRVAWEC